MALGHHFDASAVDRNVVERGPDLEARIAIEPPEAPAVLMPGQLGSAGARLVEQHRAVDRDRPGDQRPRDLFEERIVDPLPEERILLQLFDLAIVERRALVALAELQIGVVAGGGVALKKETWV